jgi:hypothetical protein
MAKAAIFTPAVIEQIRRLVRDGACAPEISQRIGCTVNSLRVTCSKLGISLRQQGRRLPQSDQAVGTRAPASAAPTQPQAQVSLQVMMEQSLMNEFQRSAAARGLSSATLAKALLEVIAQDSLYDALLDETPVQRVGAVVRQES